MANPSAKELLERPARKEARCPECGRTVALHRTVDGLGRIRLNGPLLYSYHAGSRWGRPCRQGGEVYLGDE